MVNVTPGWIVIFVLGANNKVLFTIEVFEFTLMFPFTATVIFEIECLWKLLEVSIRVSLLVLAFVAKFEKNKPQKRISFFIFFKFKKLIQMINVLHCIVY